MDGSLLFEIKRLLDNGFYEDVKSVGGFVLALDENVNIFSLTNQIYLHSYLGDAFFNSHEHRKAETMFNKAFRLHKFQPRQLGNCESSVVDHSKPGLSSSKGANKSVLESASVEVSYCNGGTKICEVDLCWRAFQCHMALRSYKEALVILENVPVSQRCMKINFALGQLYLRYGQDRGAQQAFREVLRDCPLSLETARALMQCGTDSREVLSLTARAFLNFEHADLIAQWFTAHVCSYSRDYPRAVEIFVALDNGAYLRDSPALLAALAETQYQAGSSHLAESLFRRVHNLDAQWLKYMDSFAELLHRDATKTLELEKLALALLQVTEHRSEPWIAFGYLSFATRKISRSLYFAQKAFMINNTCLHSLLLKGNGLLKHKKDKEALMHFNEARRLSPHCYQVRKGIVECYLAKRRFRDAQVKANETLRLLGTNARTLTLYASVLLKEDGQVEKARPYLERALKMDPEYLEAVYLLADVYMSQSKHEAGCKLLRQKLLMYNTSELHQMLGDFLSKTNRFREALDHYNLAVSLNPDNKKAKDGINNAELLEESTIQTDFYGFDDQVIVSEPEWSD